MSAPAKAASEIRDFAGLTTSIDPDDLESGAAVMQTNATSEIAGELRTRNGFAVVIFEEE